MTICSENDLIGMSIFDSHAHYYDEAYNGILDDVVDKMKKDGVVGAINCAVDLKTIEEVIKLSEKYDFFYSAVGFHPENLQDNTMPDLSILGNLLTLKKVVAIGEIGLDYHWRSDNKEHQRKCFDAQLKLSKMLDVPVIVHDRDAHADTMELLKKHCPSGVLHCFSGSVETAKEVLNLGMYIGIGGAVTFKNSKKLQAVAEMVPLDRLLLETDAPYMSPEPHRGETNISSNIHFVAEKIAELKGIGSEQVFISSVTNSKRLFNIK